MNKRTLNSILFFSSSLIYFYVAYIGYKKQNINLDDYDRITSAIELKGLDFHYGSKGKSECFFIKLRDTNRKLGVYRMSRNYVDLINSCEIGDTVTAYYRSNSNRSENVNIDLVQLEKDGNILIDKKEYEKKESALIYIGLIVGLLTIVLSYFYYKRKILPHS